MTMLIRTSGRCWDRNVLPLVGVVVTTLAVGCSGANNDDGSTGVSGGASATSSAPKGGAASRGGQAGIASGGGSASSIVAPATGGASNSSATGNPSGGALGNSNGGALPVGGNAGTSNRATATGGTPAVGGKPSGGMSAIGGKPNGSAAGSGALATGGTKTNGGTPAFGGATTASVPATGGRGVGGASSLGGRAGGSGIASGAPTVGGKSSGGTAAAGSDARAGSSGIVTGSIVPLYSDPSEAPWVAIVAAKQAHPTVPVIAILDPADGPGSAKNEDYVAGIATLNAVGIRAIGYVYTSYGARASATVRSDIDRWHAWYPDLDGIFFDEASYTAGGEGYYRDLTAYVRSLGMSLTVANPGTETTDAYIAAVDVTFIYENAGLPSTSMLSTWKSQYSRSNVGVIPYASNLDAAWVRSARDSVGYIYVTNDDLPNPWDTLPGFFADLLAQLE